MNVSRSLFLCVIVVCAASPEAAAVTTAGEVAGVRYTLYAPDWTWQDCNVNVLVVLENGSTRPALAEVELVLPGQAASSFTYEGPPMLQAAIPAGQTVCKAFVNILASPNAPRQVYDFAFVLRVGTAEARVPYPVRVIRGAVVRQAN